jgi:hypothetical protein
MTIAYIENRSIPEPNSGCWLWLGELRANYGIAYPVRSSRHLPNRGRVLAHRVSWEAVNGPIPKGMKVCHRCDVPSCVNPDHLFLGTQTENMADMIAKSRGAWQQGCPLPRVRGEAHPRAKLTAEQVREIRRYWDTKTDTLYRMARRYGVSLDTVWKAAHRMTWRHV